MIKYTISRDKPLNYNKPTQKKKKHDDPDGDKRISPVFSLHIFNSSNYSDIICHRVIYALHPDDRSEIHCIAQQIVFNLLVFGHAAAVGGKLELLYIPYKE